MTRSFRLRLALLSALLAGVVLAAFGLGSWWLIRSIKIERLDSEVRAAARRLVTRSPTDTAWQQEQARVGAELGVREQQDLIVLVLDDGGELAYRSAHWPLTLQAESLEWSALPLARLAPGPFWLPGALAQEPPRPAPPPGVRPPHRLGERPHPPPLEGRPPPARERNVAREASGLAPSQPAPPPLPIAPSIAQPVAPFQPAPLQGVASGTAGAVATPASTPAIPAAPPVVADPPRQAETASTQAPRPPPPRVASVVRTVNGEAWHLGLAATGVARVAIGVHARVIDADMRGIRNAFLLALPFALVLIGLGSWVIAARALRPLKKLVATTSKVTAQGLGQRIDAAGEDREFAELIEVFNRMLGRLERSFQQAHRFSADAAHELKTPLAIVQGQLERAIGQAEDGSPMQAGLTSVLDEVRRLSVISRKLLLLSQADAGRLSVYQEPVDLSRVLEDLVEDTRMLAPHLTLQAHIQPGLQVQADAGLLRQVLHNLISNAIKYNIEQGWIRISTTRWAQRIEVVIANASHGIPVQERGRIFERFFRADPARSRSVDGVGLGLSLSREIAKAHGGELSLKSDAAGAVEFSLLLPV